jgi:hypothetical protein
MINSGHKRQAGFRSSQIFWSRWTAIGCKRDGLIVADPLGTDRVAQTWRPLSLDASRSARAASYGHNERRSARQHPTLRMAVALRSPRTQAVIPICHARCLKTLFFATWLTLIYSTKRGGCCNAECWANRETELLIRALLERAIELGAWVHTSSPVDRVDAEGAVSSTCGERLQAELVVAADGVRAGQPNRRSRTPPERSGQASPAHAVLRHYAWRQHCHGLFQMPIAA